MILKMAVHENHLGRIFKLQILAPALADEIKISMSVVEVWVFLKLFLGDSP